jgi:hypothetical protein
MQIKTAKDTSCVIIFIIIFPGLLRFARNDCIRRTFNEVERLRFCIYKLLKNRIQIIYYQSYCVYTMQNNHNIFLANLLAANHLLLLSFCTETPDNYM